MKNTLLKEKLQEMNFIMSDLLVMIEKDDMSHEAIRENSTSMPEAWARNQRNLENRIAPKISDIGGEMQKLKYGQGSIIRRQRTRPNGSIYSWYQGTYRNQTVTAANYTDCLKKLSKLRQQLRTQQNKELPSEITFGEWLFKFLDIYKMEISPHTLKSYKSLLKNHVPNTLKQKKAKNITVSELQSNINEVSAKYGRTARTLYDLYGQALERAYYEGLIDRNTSGALQKRSYEYKQDNPLSIETRKKLYKVAGNFKDVLTGYIWTGCRKTELLTLEKTFLQ